MNCKGRIEKMETKAGNPVEYILPLDENKIEMNQIIGEDIELHFLNEIFCAGCGKKTPKSYAQGFCYECLISHPATSPCILRPEECRAHEGESRDMDWSKTHCLTEHIVYLALTSTVKVGVTRASQIPTRWVDQGAWKTIVLARTPNRHTAGLIEVFLKKHLTDKTNWRNMLKNVKDLTIDLAIKKTEISNLLPQEFTRYVTKEIEVTELEYPVPQYPDKVQSIGFDKTPDIKKTLTGIRGQYLIFDDNTVLNIRKHTGYFIECIFP